MFNIDFNYLATFVSGVLLGGAGIYANSFLRECGKQHVQQLKERKLKKKQKMEIDKIINYLKSKQDTADIGATLGEMRHYAFGKDSDVRLI